MNQDELSKLVTETAEKFIEDEDRVADGMTIRALVQGMLLGQMMDTGKQIIKIAQIRQETDEHGNYLPFFVVETEAGHRILVSVELMD